jgi:hypothetical protein
MAYPNEPLRDDGVVRDRGSFSRPLLIVLLVVLALIGVAWLTGLIDFDASGELRAPEVSVTGGEVPSVDVNTADIDVGTKTETIEVPTIDVEKAGDANAAAPEAKD